MSLVMPDNEHTQHVAFYTKQEMVREAEQVGASQIIFTRGKSAGLVGGPDNEPTQFAANFSASSGPAAVQ